MTPPYELVPTRAIGGYAVRCTVTGALIGEHWKLDRTAALELWAQLDRARDQGFIEGRKVDA